MNLRQIHRRTLLSGLLAGTAALTLSDLVSPKKAAADAAPKRIIFFYSPNGTIAKNFWPTQVGSSFALPPILKPLAPHKDDILVLQNIDMLNALSGPGDAHQKGTGTCLTGTELQEGDFPGDAGLSAGWADGISIDQKIAAAIGGQTVFPSIELGVLVGGSDVCSRISYKKSAEPVPPENDPYAAYTRIFGDAGEDPAEAKLRISRQQLMLKWLKAEYVALAPRLPKADRDKLDTHIASLDDLDKRLGKGTVEFGGVCQPLDLGDRIDVKSVANMPKIGRMQIDNLVMAMACDLTRVGTISWTQSRADYVYKFVDPAIAEGHHSIAHKGDQDTAKIAQNTAINAWICSQIGYLVDKLKSVPEGNGTLFDNTVIVWVNEQSKGNNHDRRNLPLVLVGSAGGYFSTGRHVMMPDGSSTNQLYVSLQNAMGIDDDSFGDPKFGKGPLPNLRA